MAFSTQKRFIAGVTCPRCAKMDKLMAYSKDGVDYRECVSCGFRDEMRLNSQPRELETRVNQASERPENRVSTVKLVNPK